MTSPSQENVNFEKMRQVVNAVLLMYSPDLTWLEDCVETFWQSYGENQDQLRIQCYGVLPHLYGLTRVYGAPPLPASKASLTKLEMTAGLRKI